MALKPVPPWLKDSGVVNPDKDVISELAPEAEAGVTVQLLVPGAQDGLSVCPGVYGVVGGAELAEVTNKKLIATSQNVFLNIKLFYFLVYFNYTINI